MNANGTRSGRGAANGDDVQLDYVTMRVAGQTFGIPVLAVREVLSKQSITRVPLAPPEIAGSLNLRGRIATAVNMRRRLGVESEDDGDAMMNVVVEFDGDLYSLLVDEVGDVLSVPRKAYEPKPVTLDPLWRDVSAGLYRLDGALLVVLDVEKLIGSFSGKDG